jgi:hypothetical protein
MKAENLKRNILIISLSALSLFVIACAGKNGVVNQNSSGNSNAQVATPGAAENRNATDNSNRPVESAEASTDEFKDTKWSFQRVGFDVAPALLREIRTAAQDGFDRIVFEFEGDEVPNYTIQYIDKPVRQCGSGNVAQVAGDGWLEVKFKATNAHTEAGQATIAARERRLSLPSLKELEITCDFEAEVVVVLGVASPNPYRVLEFSNPTRVVVDIKHNNK